MTETTRSGQLPAKDRHFREAPARSAYGHAHRVLLVGAGRRGRTAHVPALSMIDSLRLAAVVDTPSQMSDLRADPALKGMLHSSLESAIASSAPDLAIVATPHDTHLPLTLQLLSAGIPTLVEKPPATGSAEFRMLMELSQSTAVPVGIFLPLKYMPIYIRFTEFLGSAPENAEIAIYADVPQTPGIGGWRRSRARSGGGVLMDLGYHYIELLVSSLGVPDSVSACFQPDSADADEVEHTATLSLCYDNRRLRVKLLLRSMAGLQKTTTISVASAGSAPVTLLEHIVPRNSPASAAMHPDATPAPTVKATAVQLENFIRRGFLDRQGDWHTALLQQLDVIGLVEKLYAAPSSETTLEMTAV